MAKDKTIRMTSSAKKAKGTFISIPKRPVGRPDHYKPAMCDRLVMMMQEGASLIEVSAGLGLPNRETIHEYGLKYPEFGEALKRGLLLSEGWWMTQGRHNIQNKEFNSTLWYMNMKNRFGWKDKTETSGTLTVKHEDALKDLE